MMMLGMLFASQLGKRPVVGLSVCVGGGEEEDSVLRADNLQSNLIEAESNIGRVL